MKKTNIAANKAKEETIDAVTALAKDKVKAEKDVPAKKVLISAPKWKARKYDQDESQPIAASPSLPCESDSGFAGSGGTPAPSGDQTGPAEDAYPDSVAGDAFSSTHWQQG